MTSQPKTMQELWQDSYLAAENEAYLEDLYELYLSDPSQLAAEWRSYFDKLKSSSQLPGPEVPHSQIREEFLQLSRHRAQTAAPGTMSNSRDAQQERVIELINAYRRLGHLQAQTDPLGMAKGVYHPALDLSYYGFNDKDKSKTFSNESFASINKSTATLSEIYDNLRRVYCGSIGFEYMHINRAEEVEWIRERIENGWANFKPDNEVKKRILEKLIVADGLEKYLGFKYVGQKRFGLEGGDSLIPMLDTIVNRNAQAGVRETVIGMAHRGRLNVLTNIVGKDPKEIFAAFEGTGIPTTHSGDVKYHLGSASTVKTPYGAMHIALAFNPSHLEIVSPVVQGSVRARQRRRKDKEQKQVLPIQIHGDAAFAGQGVVMETFNMSQARWFCVGGSIHIVINNQVGFTISNPKDSRSTIYCTDVAKMVEAPILHVNADDPEAVYFAALLVADYHAAFKKDVVIDLVCYRRNGHNEADEPSATQPLMYKKIKSLRASYLIYAERLVKEGVIQSGDEKKIADAYRNSMDKGERVVTITNDDGDEFIPRWDKFIGQEWTTSAKTSVPFDKLNAIAEKITVLPKGFVLQAQVKKVFEAQSKMLSGEVPVSWGFAETLAYATLLDEGYAIRLCGQDAARGTFAHRHAVLHDQNTDEVYIPLSHISNNQAQINIVDSLLSEEAVLAFEYGYASSEPNNLVIWEAQFGDFANGAQVVIDQFISSGEQKWGRLCGLVMLLPHGYEGQGPEHSSARLERYLQLCAQDNMQVCVPSNASQIFHLLRRQLIRPYRKPLIVMTPKSLLRNPAATCTSKDLTEGQFEVVIPEVQKIDANKVERIIFCCGKVYYELAAKRNELNMQNVAIVRIEQLYPFPHEAVKKVLGQYANTKDIIWCQEEPQNQGAWYMMEHFISDLLTKTQKLRYAGRHASASPAVGYHAVHEKEQEELVDNALLK